MRTLIAIALVAVAACGSKKDKDSPAPAPKAAPEKAAPPSTGVVVLIEAQHMWIGNSSWWTGNEASKTDGHYKALVTGLDALGKVALPGAKAEVISYGMGANVIWKGDLAGFTGDKIGSQKDIGSAPAQNEAGALPVVAMDLAAGLTAAAADLAAMKVDRKVLLVIGDGKNGGPEIDPAALQGAKIEVHAIGVESPLGDAMDFKGDPSGFKKLTPDAKWLESGDKLAPAIAAFAASLSAP